MKKPNQLKKKAWPAQKKAIPVTYRGIYDIHLGGGGINPSSAGGASPLQPPHTTPAPPRPIRRLLRVGFGKSGVGEKTSFHSFTIFFRKRISVIKLVFRGLGFSKICQNDAPAGATFWQILVNSGLQIRGFVKGLLFGKNQKSWKNRRLFINE